MRILKKFGNIAATLCILKKILICTPFLEHSTQLFEKEIPNPNDSLKEIINSQKHRKQATLQYDFHVMYRLNLIIDKILKNLIKEMENKITSNEEQNKIYQDMKKIKESQANSKAN